MCKFVICFVLFCFLFFLVITLFILCNFCFFSVYVLLAIKKKTKKPEMRARGGGKLSKPYKNGYQIEKKKLRDGGNLPV